MISVYRYDKGAKCGQWSHTDTMMGQADMFRGSAEVLWIDLANPTKEEESFVYEKFFPVHTLTLEDVTRLRREPDAPPHFPKVEEFPDYLFVIVTPLTRRFQEHIGRERLPSMEGGHRFTQLSVIVTDNLLLTHHYEAVEPIKQLGEFLSKHQGHSERGPDYLFHLILDGIVDQYAPVLDQLDETLDDMEVKVLREPSQKLLLRLLEMKRDIILLRKALIYQREVLARMSRGEFSLIDDREMVYYRNVYDHLVRFTELIESSREMVSDLLQTHLSATSNKLNEIMKALTMISTVVLPMSVVAGIYGMNLKLIPNEDDWGYVGFAIALTMIALSGILPLAFFKWKKWI